MCTIFDIYKKINITITTNYYLGSYKNNIYNKMQIYSPEQSVNHPLYNRKGVNVSIKRDDMIHPFISGNKWRKLKYNLIKAKEQGLTKIVTFGGAWSNHLLATACAGASYQLSTKAFVRGEEVNNPVLSMCKLFGMELTFIPRDDYKDKRRVYDQMDNKDEYYFIDEGGAGYEAIQGCTVLVGELHNPYDHVLCAAGTGTTAAGIAIGLGTLAKVPRLHIIPVLKGGESIWDELKLYRAPINNCDIHTDYHFGGYAKVKPELIAFIKDFVSTTGIMIEPTYTGKALFALHDLIEKDYFKKGSNILFIHTGGLTGYLGMLDKF